jgi:hypothetical protein
MNSKFEEIILSRAWTGRLLMKVLSAEKIFWIWETLSEGLYNLHDSSTIVKLRGRTEWNVYQT